MPSKLTKQLRERLDRTPSDDLIDVVLEIVAPIPPPAGASRSEAIASRRKHFLEAVAPVEQRIQQMGGKVLEHAWINQTVRARVPAGTLDQLTESDDVASVDMPAPLSRE